MPAPTHAFSAPIPPGTLRISVIADDELFAADFSTAKLSVTLKAFVDHAGLDASDAPTPQASERCKETAAAAAEDGDVHLVTVGALWLWLRQPGGQAEMNGDRLTAMIDANGACMLTVTAPSQPGGVWDFCLFAMPRWPAVVAPYRSTQRDRRRRWR